MTPLAGIRVLDFTHVFAGPFCTRCLADLGAEVVHVETRGRVAPPSPDTIRDRRGAEDRPGYAHRNKLAVTIDLKTQSGQRIATQMAEKADILIENFSSGVMGRLRLNYARLQPLNPRLIYVSMSGYGHGGPRRDWTSMNMNLQGFSGLMLTTGSEGDPPTAISNSWNDYIAGLHASFEILEALAEREETGVGKNIDLAQFEASVGTMGPLLLASMVDHEPPPRLGNRSTSRAPQGCYPCLGKDEWCTLSVETDEQWRRLAALIGHNAWAADRGLASAVGRMRRHDEIDGAIAAWTSDLESAEVERRLKEAGIPAERMRRADAIVDATDAGQGYARLDTAVGQPTVVARLPYSFSASDAVEPTVVPELGADTREALRRWLGLADSEVDRLEAEGALN